MTKWLCLPVSVRLTLYFILTVALLLAGPMMAAMSMKQLSPVLYGMVVTQPLLRLMVICVGLVAVIFVIIRLELARLLQWFNRVFYTALSERSLEGTFPEFYTATTWKDAVKNLSVIFSTFKSLDHLKAGRVSLEVNTVKLLTNRISEGTILVNKDKVVTHINSVGEQMLKLIPGESVGQSIVRKVNHDHLIGMLDQALVHEEKVTGVMIAMPDETQLIVDILPIHDKFGSVIRALIVLKLS